MLLEKEENMVLLTFDILSEENRKGYEG